MKRYAILAALSILLLVALNSSVSARSHPWEVIDPSDFGDDHTWGGEQGWGDDINPVLGGSGVFSLDYILNHLLSMQLIDTKFTRTTTTIFVVPTYPTPNEKPETKPRISSKGN